MVDSVSDYAGFSQGEPADQPFTDRSAYGCGPEDSTADTSENAAVTHRVAMIGDAPIPYTATAGHLVALDPSSSRPAAKVFYVAFAADDRHPSTRPVTFFCSGGPGSSLVFHLLGAFAPRRIRTWTPGLTPRAPCALEDNPDSLVDRSDLVYIHPVGTGYSTAIAPHRNRDFWSVDQDAISIRQFIKRYLTVFDRWASPIFLFGESYGAARACVLSWLLRQEGMDLSGLTLQSSVLDYPANFTNAVGLLPTFAADAWHHRKLGLAPPPADLPRFMKTVTEFARGPYAKSLHAFPRANPVAVATMSRFLGLPSAVLQTWNLNVRTADRVGHLAFLLSLLRADGYAVGAYDGRVRGIDARVAAVVGPDGGVNDPTLAAVAGVYAAMWKTCLVDELKFTARANFTFLNDQALLNWDFSHRDPAGALQAPDGQGNPTLCAAGDLAATMASAPHMQVLSANGYFDAVAPFLQSKLTLEAMSLADPKARGNIAMRAYPSGHTIHLDAPSRAAMKADLARMYAAAATHVRNEPKRFYQKRIVS